MSSVLIWPEAKAATDFGLADVSNAGISLILLFYAID